MTFAARLHALRRNRGLTLDALAAATLCNPQTLSRLERGLLPSLDVLARLARAMEIPAAELAGLAVADRIRAIDATEGRNLR